MMSTVIGVHSVVISIQTNVELKQNIRMKLRIVSLAVCLMCGGFCLWAQDEVPAQAAERNAGQLAREIPSPERNARKTTSAMKRELGLTDKQYDKIYKLNLKEQKELFAAAQAQPAMGQRGAGMGNRPSGGGMGGGRMGGGQPPMGSGGQRPPMGGDGFGQGMPGGSAKVKTDEDWQKAAEKKEQKIKKILTAEQYSKWQAIAAEYQAKPVRAGKPSQGGGHPGHPGQSEFPGQPEVPDMDAFSF